MDGPWTLQTPDGLRMASQIPTKAGYQGPRCDTHKSLDHRAQKFARVADLGRCEAWAEPHHLVQMCALQ